MSAAVRLHPRSLAAVAAAGLFGLLAGWTPLAAQIDNYATDWLFRVHRPAPWVPQSAILALDEDSFEFTQGVRNLRSRLAEAIAITAAAGPRVIALDVILADAGQGGEDAALAAAIRNAGNVILPCELLPGPRWMLARQEFRQPAAALGHVHADPDERDGMSRHMPLEKAGARERHWALSLEAFRLLRKAPVIESPESLEVAGLTIPASRSAGRLLRIRYLPPGPDDASRIPHLSLRRLLEDPSSSAIFRDKAVFVGATAQSAMRDRMMTPYSTLRPMPGVEIHAHALETLLQGRFFHDAAPSLVLLLALASIAAAAFVFQRFSGPTAYALGGAIILAAHVFPHVFFLNGVIYPYVAPTAAAWFSVTCAAVLQYFRTRDQLARTEGERTRYQEAIQFVTHEMRTPLSAIQGSSELMNRYRLPEEKQKELSRQIHAESKRLGRMIQTFLDVERLSAGQMELKREPFDASALLDGCVERVLPLAERKSIAIERHPSNAAALSGDRELMEYAVYNLLTNAVKYSPPETRVDVRLDESGGSIRLAVADQGIGMSPEEIARIGQKFFRSKGAEQSGEVGTGIGLSIVQQIVTHHGGRLQVTSSPGHGSCFTMIVPAMVTPTSTMPNREM